MTYSRPYVNNMLKNHPHGDKFEEIRHLAYWVGTYLPPIPDPEEEEQTRAQKILYFILRIIVLIVLTFLAGGYRFKERRNNPKYFEPLKQKMSELMDVLDYSKDSIWLVTYMIEEGVSDCPYAVSVFEEYLEKCELNP